MDERIVTFAMDTHGKAVLRSALSVTGNRPDAEDVFSDVFFALFKRDEKFESDEHLKAWLIRVAVNKAKNLAKSAHRTKTAPLSDNLAAPEFDSGYDVPAAMQVLAPDDRAVLYLHYYEGYSYGEIAVSLSLREASVRSRAARAREKLKALLSD